MANLLDLSPEVRSKIYERVLIVPHPLYLFQEPGASVDIFAPDRPHRWSALLHVNRQIHRETSTVLYGMNVFHFVDITQKQVSVIRSFLTTIGLCNAAQVSRLCINFPVVERTEQGSGEIRLRDDSLQSLTLLRESCKGLRTIEFVIHFENAGVFTESEQFLREALSLVNMHLRSISTLERVLVRIEAHDQVPTSSTRRTMQELEWSIMA